MSKKLRLPLLAVVAAILTALGLITVACGQPVSCAESSTSSLEAAVPPAVPPVAEELSRGFQAVSETVQPSVVSIATAR